MPVPILCESSKRFVEVSDGPYEIIERPLTIISGNFVGKEIDSADDYSD